MLNLALKSNYIVLVIVIFRRNNFIFHTLQQSGLHDSNSIDCKKSIFRVTFLPTACAIFVLPGVFIQNTLEKNT